METLHHALQTLDQFTLVIATCAGLMSFWLIREMIGSTALACISAPVLMLGALAANYLFHTHYVVATHDKDTNVVVASAVGVLVALVLLLVSIWISVLMSEHRSKHRKLMQLPDTLPPAGE